MAHVPEGRYVPADTNGGWGVAAFIILLVAVCIATATYIHRKTYLHPQDVRWHTKGEATYHGG
jgi:hypothetical protein